MALDNYSLFNSGGWQVHSDFTDNSSTEVSLETCFYLSNIKPNNKHTMLSSKSKTATHKRVREVKTMLSLTDMTLIHDLQEVDQFQDATVPVFEHNLTDLAGQITPTLEVLSSLETLGPGGPLGLLGGTFPTVETVSSVLTQNEDPCLGSSNLHDMDVNETFQDLTELFEKSGPILSPTDSCSTIDSNSSISPASLHSNLHSPAHFFPTSEEFSFKSPHSQSSQTPSQNYNSLFSTPSTSGLCQRNSEELPKSENRYVAMRKKNNIASKRSRQTRREREVENEQKVKKLEDDNDDLRAQVKKLEEMTEAIKKYLIQSVMKR